MNLGYPIVLHLEGKCVVVVGGGKVAERKVRGLLGTGAKVVVISPEVTEDIKSLDCEGKIVWKQKSFGPGDIDNAFLIFAATNNNQLNQLVKKSAQSQQLVTLADDPDGSDFHVPAQVQRGSLSIAISTGGASPTLASQIREQLEQQFDDSYVGYLDFLALKRKWILNEVENPSLKRQLLKSIVSPAFLTSNQREEDFIRLYQSLLTETEE